MGLHDNICEISVYCDKCDKEYSFDIKECADIAHLINHITIGIKWAISYHNGILQVTCIDCIENVRI